jgi:hypothetical protein
MKGLALALDFERPRLDADRALAPAEIGARIPAVRPMTWTTTDGPIVCGVRRSGWTASPMRSTTVRSRPSATLIIVAIKGMPGHAR